MEYQRCEERLRYIPSRKFSNKFYSPLANNRENDLISSMEREKKIPSKFCPYFLGFFVRLFFLFCFKEWISLRLVLIRRVKTSGISKHWYRGVHAGKSCAKCNLKDVCVLMVIMEYQEYTIKTFVSYA